MDIALRETLKSQTKRVVLLDTESESSEAVFDKDYAHFKIAPMTIDGIGVAAEIELLVGGRPVILNNDTPILMTFAAAEFVWIVTLIGGADHLSLRFSAPATEDVFFQITGYGQATTF